MEKSSLATFTSTPSIITLNRILSQFSQKCNYFAHRMVKSAWRRSKAFCNNGKKIILQLDGIPAIFFILCLKIKATNLANVWLFLCKAACTRISLYSVNIRKKIELPSPCSLANKWRYPFDRTAPNPCHRSIWNKQKHKHHQVRE